MNNKQEPLFISFSIQVFPSILFHTSLPTAVPTVLGTVRVVVISLSFPSFNPQSINPSNSLVIVLLLMLPLFGMLFPRRFVRPTLWPPSENASKPTFTPRHTLLSLTYPLAFSVVHGLFSVFCIMNKPLDIHPTVHHKPMINTLTANIRKLCAIPIQGRYTMARIKA